MGAGEDGPISTHDSRDPSVAGVLPHDTTPRSSKCRRPISPRTSTYIHICYRERNALSSKLPIMCEVSILHVGCVLNKKSVCLTVCHHVRQGFSPRNRIGLGPLCVVVAWSHCWSLLSLKFGSNRASSTARRVISWHNCRFARSYWYQRT